MENSIQLSNESVDVNQNDNYDQLRSNTRLCKSLESKEELDSDLTEKLQAKENVDTISARSINNEFETSESAIKKHSSVKSIEKSGLNLNDLKDSLSSCEAMLSEEHKNVVNVPDEVLQDDGTTILPGRGIFNCGDGFAVENRDKDNNVRGEVRPNIKTNETRDDDDFEDALDFVADHFAENSDDEAKDLHEEKVLIKDMSDVGRYSYACLVAHSLHTLFDYSSTNKKFQEQCLKLLLKRLGHNKKMQKTMFMVLRGEISLGVSDPLVDSMKKEFPNPKTGSLSIIEDLLEMALKEGVYDARMRTLLRFLSLLFGVRWEEVEDLEDQTQERFQEEGHEPTEEEKKEKLDKMKSRRFKRIALVSIAAVGGGALIGLTAGIAAPLIAVGAGAVIGGVGAAGLGTVAGAAIIGSIFGVAGAGLTGFKMKKRIGELEEFEFEPLTQGRSLHVTVAVSGWLNDKHTDFRSVWLGLANSKEQYILRYESKYLRELGQAMEYIANIAITAAVKHTLKQTLLSGLLAAISWPLTLLSVASIIDNPWSICTQRSVNAGRQLAEVLLSRQQGRRPVTLIGFSFGARVIFSCLEEMASRKNSEGIVEDVVLLGAPVSGCEEDWSRLEKVVAGRIVNGYCRGDWLLKFMYRTASAQLTIAGLTPVKWENRRMHNIDLTDIVSGHLDYFNQIDSILNSIGIKTIEHAEIGSSESLKQWTSLRQSDSKELSSTTLGVECTKSLGMVDEEISDTKASNLESETNSAEGGKTNEKSCGLERCEK